MSTFSYRNFTGSAAENYQRYFVPAIATPVSAELLRIADLQRGERVLDVACGTGLIARLAADLVGPTGSVTAIDIAPDMIDFAKTIESPLGIPIEWHVCDAASLPLADDSYDVVLCQMGLMFIDDRAAAVAEMRRVLAPGGRLVVNTPGRIQRTFEIMKQAIMDHINAEVGGGLQVVFSMHDPGDVAALLRQAGLDDVTSSTYIAKFQLPAPAEFLWQYINLTPMAPFVAQASEAAQAAMERQVVEQWQSYVVDGTMPVDQQMMIASGRK